MKKLIVATCVAAACSAAIAQSSVTVFGVLDASLNYGTGSIGKSTQVGSSGLSTSRLGFRGVEDLGGGLAAAFWLESQLAVNTGGGSSTNTNNQGIGVVGSGALVFNRRSTISLSDSSWGEIRLGRDYTPTFLAQADYDPFGVVGIGATQSLFGAIAATAPYSRNGASSSVGVRASNEFEYLLPKNRVGVYGTAMVFRGNNPSNIATASDGNGTSARIGWSGGPVDVSAAFTKTRYQVGDLTTKTAGGAYKFDNGLKLSASYVRDDVAGSLPDGKGWLVGVVLPVGVGVIQSSYSSYHLNDATHSGARKIAAAYIYNLSKRTALYGVIARLSNQGASTQVLNGAVTAAGERSSGVTVGVRHTF